MRLLPSIGMLLVAMWLLHTVRDNGVKQHTMYCGWASDYIRGYADKGPIFEKAVASWRKFQIEDNCPADGVR